MQISKKNIGKIICGPKFTQYRIIENKNKLNYLSLKRASEQTN